MNDEKLNEIYTREVRDRRWTTFHVALFGIAILGVVSTLVVAARWIAMTIR